MLDRGPAQRVPRGVAHTAGEVGRLAVRPQARDQEVVLGVRPASTVAPTAVAT